MKSWLAFLGPSAVVGLAAPAPAHADPGPGPDAPQSAEEVAAMANDSFLESLRAAGITFDNPGRVVEAGRAVCGLVNRGESGLQVVGDIKANNPGFTTDGAAQFAAISARSFCPHQLAKK